MWVDFLPEEVGIPKKWMRSIGTDVVSWYVMPKMRRKVVANGFVIS